MSVRLAVIITLSILVQETGCVSPSVGRAQFDRLRLGMTPTEVEEILGKGKPIEAGEVQRLLGGGDSAPDLKIDMSELRGVRWGSEKKSITVIYRNDRLFRAFQQGL